MAFELPTDIGRFRRSTSPRQFWENTVKWYIPQTAGQQVTLRQQLTNFQVPKTSDPVQKLLEIEDHAELMRDAGIKVDDQSVYGAYVAALFLPEYQPEIRELKREQVFDREHIIRLVRAAHELLKDNKKKSPSALAFISDGRNGGGGRGHPGAKRGGRGDGRGRSNSGNGKAKSSDDDGKDAAEDGKKPVKGPMCYNYHVKGHFAADCKTKVCKKCGGRGHDKSNVRPQRTWRLPLRWSCRVMMRNLRLRESVRQDPWQKRWMRCVGIPKPMWHQASAMVVFQPVV